MRHATINQEHLAVIATQVFLGMDLTLVTVRKNITKFKLNINLFKRLHNVFTDNGSENRHVRQNKIKLAAMSAH
jgi:hypothetical protein